MKRAAMYQRVHRGHGSDLIWPEKCERCGTTESVVKHHDDYKKPMAITYLCATHHAERHVELGWGIGGRPKKVKNLQI